MEQVLESGPASRRESGVSAWKSPAGWLLEKKLNRSFWIFFTVAFFFDFGFSVYYFLFNLYLLDFHFNERIIGLVGGALTLGSVVGTLPVGWLARKVGLASADDVLLDCSALVMRTARNGDVGVARRLGWRFWLGWQCASGECAFHPWWQG